MNAFKILLIILCINSAGFAATTASETSAPTCPHCKELVGLLADTDSVAPNPLNRHTIEAQNWILRESEDLAARLITEKNLPDETIEKFVLLLVRLVPYDNSASMLYVVGDQVHSLFKAKAQNRYKTALARLFKAGAITASGKKQFEEYYGLIGDQI